MTVLNLDDWVETKICSKCGVEKPLDEFYKEARGKYGRGSQCKACRKQYFHGRKEEVSVYNARYNLEHKKEILQYNAKYYQENQEYLIQYAMQYRKEHSEEISQHQAQYYKQHREEILQGKVIYRQKNKDWINGKQNEIHAAFVKRVVLFAGGKCEICGLMTDYYEVYHCHHKNKKEYLIKDMKHMDWETEVVPELLKCMLLCTECHNALTSKNARLNPNRSRNAIYCVNRRDARKWKCIDYIGKGCQICGRVHSELPKYEFHHVDPTIKKFTISPNLLRPWEILRPELDKCCLLCGNCHTFVTHGRYNHIILIPGPRVVSDSTLTSGTQKSVSLI